VSTYFFHITVEIECLDGKIVINAIEDFSAAFKRVLQTHV